jgi:hypothetical protein
MRTATSLLGLFTLLGCTAGCEFWGKDKTRYYTYCDGTGCYTCDPGGCAPTGGRVGGSCASPQQCPEGCYCDSGSGTCVEGGSCQSSQDCPSGFSCNTARRSCQPDASDAGVRLPDGAGLDVDAGRPPSCTVDCDCGGQQVCQNARCVAAPPDPSVGCTFNHECGSGQCVNNRCQARCSSNNDCGTGDVCQGGFCLANPAPRGGCTYNVDCGPGSTCINSACHGDCQSNSDCKNPRDFCDSGICKPDWRRVPQCRDNGGCAASEECVNAVCRAHCWINADCGSCVNQPVCQLGYCVAPFEVNPMCTGQSGCAPGQSCVNASCR